MTMDPRDPSILDARDAGSEYIVYYSQDEKRQWHFERVSDGEILHRGTLEEMLDLLPQYPKSRAPPGLRIPSGGSLRSSPWR